MNENALTHLY